ncbi:ABC transporter ATP-binding protein [Cyclobacterium jeungdonense]|uniref:ABC transporter ATP-binding protein n=1 Tax=Cyclobacterium jeungdonense TaxID=708087 RepID=A0ABT8C2Q9_9BACT|nr:ABC transporter ATP-binding protein [Cyclobacterium jeungdonense]MDN3686642.1 ABC transporter ATP-binding protein [Cyclobacterium jeungdonense]
METYLRILAYARPYRRYFPQYVLYAFLAIVFGLLNFTLLKPLFDVIFEQVGPEELQAYSERPEFSFTIQYFMHLFNYYFLEIANAYGKFGTLVYVCVIIVISVFLSNLFAYLSGVVLAKVRADIIQGMRVRIFTSVSRMHLGYFSTERKGDLISKMTNDIQEVENSIVQSLRVVFKEPVTVILYFAVLFFMSVQLTLFTILLIPVSGAIIGYVTKRLKKSAEQSQESLGRIVNILDETIGGMRVVKAFGARKFVQQKFEAETGYYASVNVSMARKYELASPISQFLGVTVVAGILLYGGNLVLTNSSSLSASEFIAYIILFTQVLNPAKEISRAVSSIQRGLASARRIFAVVDAKPEINEIPAALPLAQFNDSVEFQNVGFAYQETPVLKGINFVLKKGKTIALVGPSGGGKSTLADLLPRFYDPTEGMITIDGKDIKSLKISDLRHLMGIVTQESILFNDSVYQNIAFGMEGISQEKVEKAATIANAHDFIMKLEQGYQTNIGERGTKLSGGQRQRLSIARAVLKNPAILILDEATSALDSASERLVQEALAKLMANRTSLVIAHRLSTIQYADEILVIEGGQIVERGTHDELMESNGLYKKLSQMQSV